MNSQENFAYWSFPLGNWFGIRVRLSWFFPFLIAYFLLEFQVRLGLVISGILILSVLLHEFGHIVGARLTGGSGDEILLWPLGGLAFVRPAGTLMSQLLTTGGGPLVNLALCLGTLAPTIKRDLLREALNPLTLPPIALEDQLVSDLLVLTFSLNALLLIVNLIPVMPLDGGRMLRTIATTRIGHRKAIEISVIVGFVVGVIAMVAGLFTKRAEIVLIGAMIFIMNLIERQQLMQSDQYDESFMGYDFSQGYTSLEKSDLETERSPGFFKRWREKRQQEKDRRQAEKDLEAERVVDELLDKVHQSGIESLTEAEKRMLTRASARYRNKDNPQT